LDFGILAARLRRATSPRTDRPTTRSTRSSAGSRPRSSPTCPGTRRRLS